MQDLHNDLVLKKVMMSLLQISKMLFLDHFSTPGPSNPVRHVEKPFHTNFELIWLQERRIMTILRFLFTFLRIFALEVVISRKLPKATLEVTTASAARLGGGLGEDWGRVPTGFLDQSRF